MVETAAKLGTKPAIVALAWVLSKPYVTAPIIGASKPHHLADAVAALELKLDARTIAKLEEPYRRSRSRGIRDSLLPSGEGGRRSRPDEGSAPSGAALSRRTPHPQPLSRKGRGESQEHP